jgi:hypothetical protein
LVIGLKILKYLSYPTADKQNPYQVKTDPKCPNGSRGVPQLNQLGHFSRYLENYGYSGAHQDPSPNELHMILWLIVFFHIQVFRMHAVLSAFNVKP